MLITNNVQFSGCITLPEIPEPKAKAKGNGRAGNRRPEAEVAPVRRNSEAEKGIAGKLSTKAEPDAWKQAVRKADKSTGKTQQSRENREEGKRRDERLSSQNLNRTGRKKGTARGYIRRKRLRGIGSNVSTCGTAVGAKQGRTKGNKQKAEYAECGVNGRETSRENTGKT